MEPHCWTLSKTLKNTKMNLQKYLMYPFPLWLLLQFFCILFFYSSPAFSFNTDSGYALLVDYKTNQILFEKNSTKRIFPASMSKLMTLYVLFDYLDKGVINMTDEFVISENDLVAITEISWSPVRVFPLEVTLHANSTDKSAPVTV